MMLPETLSTRGVHFAFLFGPPRFVARAEASTLYDQICDKLKLDDFNFKYGSPTQDESPQSKGFSIQLERKEGRGLFGIKIDNPNIQNPMRLLLVHNWPPSLEHVKELFDQVAEAVFAGLKGDWTKAHAEVRIRAQCGVRAENALRYLRDDIFQIPSAWVDSLGQPLKFLSICFDTASAPPVESSLENPARELKIETLREDPDSLYFELVSKWLQAPDVAVAAQAIDTASLRPIDASPSDYVASSHEFLYTRLRELNRKGGTNP